MPPTRLAPVALTLSLAALTPACLRGGVPLEAAKRDVVRAWIAQGAVWSPGWAFTPPLRPPLPEVKQTAWPRGELDRFILAALEQRGWRPAPEADRRAAVR